MTRLHKALVSTAAGLFGAVAIVHLVRVVAGWSLVLGSWEAPAWVSVLAALVTGGLSAAFFWALAHGREYKEA